MSMQSSKVRFFRARYLIWLIVPAAFFAVHLVYGFPHLRWSYDWRDDGQGFNPFANRFYLRCTYLDLTGLSAPPTFTIHHPRRGHCPIIRFRGRATAE